MTEIIDRIGICPAPIQGISMQIQKCLDVIKDVTRIVIKDPDGTDPFNTGAVTTAGTQAALKASFEDKTVWDAAIALSDVNRLTLTPEVQDAQRPKVLIEPIELPNTSRINPGSLPDVLSTYTIYGISADNHETLIVLSGLKRDFLLIDFSGKTIYKNITDAEVANGDSPWFNAKHFNVSTRDVMTGAGNADNIDVSIYSPFGDLDRYTLADTGAFGLIL